MYFANISISEKYNYLEEKFRKAYKWLAEQMDLTEDRAHIGSFEMDQCQMVIELCRKNSEEAA